MKTKVNFKCQSCGHSTQVEKKIGSKIETSILCDKCQGTMTRVFGDIGMDTIDENVSYATNQMLYSKMPSGKDKTVL